MRLMAKGMFSGKLMTGHAFVAGLLGLAAVGGTAGAQCQREWLPGGEVQGTDGPISASTLWDPDGSGPEAAKIVYGASFGYAGGVRAERVAVYNPQTGEWSALPQQFPSFFSSNITGISSTADGGLVVVGEFRTSSTGPRSFAYRWNTQAWTEIPVSTADSVFSGNRPFVAVAGMPNGDIVVGGTFDRIGGVDGRHIARWNGTQWVPWSPAGTGFQSTADAVRALAVAPNGDLIVGGRFTRSVPEVTSLIVRWNGSEWSTLGGPNGAAAFGSSVEVVRVLPNGSILAAGGFNNSLGGSTVISNIGLFDGTAWTNVGEGLQVFRLFSADVAPNGDVLAAVVPESGRFMSVYRRVGSAWSVLGFVATGPRPALSLRSIDTERFLVAGSELRTPQQVGLNFIAWDGQRFVAPVNGPDGGVSAVRYLPDGDLIAAGSFTAIDEQTLNSIARRRGNAWLPLGSGLGGTVRSVERLPNGDLVAGGAFVRTGSGDGVSVNRAARWNGSEWLPLGAGFDNGSVWDLGVLSIGNIVAVGDFRAASGRSADRVALWDGSAWNPVGTGLNGTGVSVLPLDNGEFIVGGSFTTAGGVPANNIARWNGTVWSPLGQGIGGSVSALRRLPGGEIVAGGFIFQAGGAPVRNVAAWDGSSWSSLGAGLDAEVLTLGELDGQLVAGGRFAGTVARWDGTAWRVLGTGLAGGLDPFNSPLVRDLDVAPTGALTVGGSFAGAGDVVSANLATLACLCPADFDGNGTLDFFDYLDFVAAFAAGEPRADFNRDGAVDFFDYLDFVARFDLGC